METKNQNTQQELDSRVEQLLTPHFAPSADEIKLTKPQQPARKIWLNALHLSGIAAALVIGLFIIISPNRIANASVMAQVDMENIDKTAAVQPDEKPTFDGGDLMKFVYWVSAQVKYPEEAIEKDISGRVLAEFFVEKDGTVTFSKALKSPHEILSKEVERVIKLSPKWTPAIVDGKPVRTKYCIPVVFKYNEETGAANDVPAMQPDVQPTFEGGDLMKFAYWVNAQIKYPEEAIEKEITGRVLVEFFVETDGSVTFSQVLKSPHEVLSNEVIRVIKLSPKWTPATVKGKAVKVKYAIPVNFQFANE